MRGRCRTRKQSAGMFQLQNGTLVRILPPRIDRVAYPGMKVVDDIYDNVHASQLRPLGIALYAQLPQLIAVGDI